MKVVFIEEQKFLREFVIGVLRQRNVQIWAYSQIETHQITDLTPDVILIASNIITIPKEFIENDIIISTPIVGVGEIDEFSEGIRGRLRGVITKPISPSNFLERLDDIILRGTLHG